MLSAYLLLVGIRALTQDTPELRDTVRATGGTNRIARALETNGVTLGQQILSRNIFDSQTGPIPWEDPRALPPTAVEEGEQATPDWVDCPSDMRLLATVVSTLEDRSVASVRLGEQSQLMRIGDVTAGAELTGIEPSYVYFRLATGSSCALPLFLSGPPVPRLVAGPLGKQGRPAFFAKAELEDSVTDLGAGRYQVRRELVEQARADGGLALVQGVKFKPRMKKGKVVGMTVKKIREDSLLYKLGVREGDLLRNVNGFALSGPDGLLSAYTALQDQSKFSLALSRKGKIETLQYTFH